MLPKSKEHTATAFTARGTTKKHSGEWHGYDQCGEVVIYTDQGAEPVLVVSRNRLRALIQACLDALEGEHNTY
jgi:hypothetical protein